MRYELFPLVYPEIADFDLDRALNHGLLPRHYLGRSPQRLLQAYWRTVSQIEVDCVLGDHEVAVEIKSTDQADGRHLKGLREFREEFGAEKLVLVSRDPRPRVTDDGIEILPWRVDLSGSELRGRFR